ncbi:MAG: hypothetical protein DIU61_006095 [Bacteroidota bacterium]|jgi:hypothetical protein|nr:MAG: hypothetical protein DIU61_01725 [Bacteroidota bacterium]
MTLFSRLFGKTTKKKELKARCPITREQIDRGFGYLLTTAEVVTSRKYWDMVMTEPETMSYTISHFRNEEHGTRMRSLIFEKYSSIPHPWIISDTCINLFEGIDRERAKRFAQLWWEQEGEFVPENSGPALEMLDPKSYQDWKDYAILEAGRSRISA